MFDHNRFDRNAFDRETVQAPNLLEALLFGDSSFNIDIGLLVELHALIVHNYGGIETEPVIKIEHDVLIDSYGEINITEFILLFLPLTIHISSYGDLELPNIGTTETSKIDLRNISLLPNETLIIDTDLMTVSFGTDLEDDANPASIIVQRYDVSSLTVDSTFFELGNGTNRLIFYWTYLIPPDPMPTNQLDTTVIWQNRWL